MKRLILGAVFALTVLHLGMAPARADDATCTATAVEKKLAGAAKTSFMKKCQADAAKTCDATAGEKNLKGAAKTSFTKKCVSTAVGT